MKITRPLESRH